MLQPYLFTLQPKLPNPYFQILIVLSKVPSQSFTTVQEVSKAVKLPPSIVRFFISEMCRLDLIKNIKIANRYILKLNTQNPVIKQLINDYKRTSKPISTPNPHE